MNLEIHKPEFVHRVNAHIQAGHFHDAEELLEKALDALDERATAAAAKPATGAVVLAALRARPYREIDLTPPRVPMSKVRIAEVRSGIELQEDAARRAELNDWLTLTLRPTVAGRILPVTEGKNGHTYSHPDLVLAATALHHGFTVVTRDRWDFDKARVPVFNLWET